jgi:trehalose 6-phosphate synthase
VLSETVGAHEQLGEYALSVAPADLEGTAQALYEALTMPPAERKRRARALKKSIAKEDLSNWLYCLLDDASRLT